MEQDGIGKGVIESTSKYAWLHENAFLVLAIIPRLTILPAIHLRLRMQLQFWMRLFTALLWLMLWWRLSIATAIHLGLWMSFLVWVRLIIYIQL